MNKTEPRLILCMKWGAAFEPDYVNILYRACRNHTTGPLRFVCLTDDGKGLHPDIDTFPIPEIGLTQDQWYTRGIWPKLAMFQNELCGLSDRALFIDLDMMVVGSLDPFFEPKSRLITLDVGVGWRPGGTATPEVGTGVFAFDIGDQRQILDSFIAHRDQVISDFFNEQDYVGDKGEELSFWPKEKVISFKRFLRKGYGRDLIKTPPPPNSDVAIVAFHGAPRPIDLVKPGIWGRFPHVGRGPINWVQDYWKKYASE